MSTKFSRLEVLIGDKNLSLWEKLITVGWSLSENTSCHFRPYLISWKLPQKSWQRQQPQGLNYHSRLKKSIYVHPATEREQNTGIEGDTQRYQSKELTQESLKITETMILLVTRNQLVSHTDKKTGVAMISCDYAPLSLNLNTTAVYDNANWISLTKITSMSEIITQLYLFSSCLGELSIIPMLLLFDMCTKFIFPPKQQNTKHLSSWQKVMSHINDNKWCASLYRAVVLMLKERRFFRSERIITSFIL